MCLARMIWLALACSLSCHISLHCHHGVSMAFLSLARDVGKVSTYTLHTLFESYENSWETTVTSTDFGSFRCKGNTLTVTKSLTL